VTKSITQTIDEIVTEISMSVDKLPWLIIEGRTDNKFFITKNLPKKPKHVIALGWENVIGVISKIFEEKISAEVYGFIDRDYIPELYPQINIENIVQTDYRDLEISMFESEALHKILVELGSELKMPYKEDKTIHLDHVKQRVYEVAAFIGRIRFFCLKNALQISLTGLDYSKFIDSNNLSIDCNKFIAQLNSKSNVKISLEQVKYAQNIVLPNTLTDFKFLCCGHDVIEIFGISLRRLWGTNNSGDVDKMKLESHFRIGYSNAEFENTNMYNSLCILLNS
jgi:Protein of unknown function (DUF4435)